MLEHLSFKGEWREYQKRILEKNETIMADGHIHLVAAPGSGKTTLGIEFIRRAKLMISMHIGGALFSFLTRF